MLALGARFEEQETNWRPSFLPDPAACTIQVDIDPAEIGRSVVPRIGTVGDIRLVLQGPDRERAWSAAEGTPAITSGCVEASV